MAYGQEIANLWNRQSFWVHSTPAFYPAAAADIFAITGGLVLIEHIIEYCDVDPVNGTTTTIAVGVIGMDAGAIAINAAGALGIVVSPLNVGGAKIASALAVQAPSLVGFNTNQGVIAGPGVNITVTFATVMVAAGRYSLHVKYRKIHPNALIA